MYNSVFDHSYSGELPHVHCNLLDTHSSFLYFSPGMSRMYPCGYLETGYCDFLCGNAGFTRKPIAADLVIIIDSTQSYDMAFVVISWSTHRGQFEASKHYYFTK